MSFLWFLILVYPSSIQAQQYYDKSDCLEGTNNPGSRYICNSNPKSCSTFLVYRANQHFNTISNVSRLFQRDSEELLRLNNLSFPSEILEQGREVLVPVTCSCIGTFFQVSISYKVPDKTTLSEIACSLFEGLVKLHTLIEENPSENNDIKVDSELDIPLRCACPDKLSTRSEVQYLVTYPLLEGDALNVLSQKFGISTIDLWAANHLEPLPTVYPNTTILVPLKKPPVINFNIPSSPPPIPGFLPTITVENTTSTKLMTLYVSVSVVGFCLIIISLVACGCYAKVFRKRKIDKLQSFNTRSSPSSPRSGQIGSSGTSCISPDLLVGIKYSLKNYSIDDLRKATEDFSKENKIGDRAYKGLINNVEMMVKQLKFEETRQIIDVHSKINHINIVKLIGVCYGDNDFSWSYLVFELPVNGSLRDCLSKSSSSLRWHRRTQIAFDIATGLHYLHYCIFPSYAHMSVNSRNIFVTANGRAKLANIKFTAESTTGNQDTQNAEGWTVPESILYGSASDKVDTFAFGVVLLELLSGREDTDGKLSKECIGFLGGDASEGGCFEQLQSFIDPCLKEDYPLSEALCLSVLAKACVADDPLHRPSMDNILKVLVRLV
ncbi:serine-threonine protein kinase, plant-type, putative [Ricinus communis]|uniref:Serine-threonine protein kinase, plant-type, putative n=1 Tax=Ricinus communis TaxID=3988 RepID=B9STU7_RICCO|nr:serine-threonine protein kinase, plant-type, putative [Ricinus communis]|eukprot:XP_002529416.1 lysM domain receptor-like kinase 4 [Ricinus communis]